NVDAGVLDDGDEVLVNPNIMDNERHKRNVELKKRKKGKGFDDAFDEYGNAKPSQLLAKYDEELEGVQKSTFRLNEKGEVDLAAEEEEARARARMEMAGKTLVSLDQDKFKVASEFYTQEEMVSFRKPKKNKKERTGRKKLKALKADDLLPLEEENGRGRDMGSRKTRGRHGEEEEEEREETKVKKEEVEMEGEDDGEGGVQRKGWKKATKGAVDIDSLRRLAEKEEEEEESDDDMMAPDANLAGIVIDDDATDELSSVLDRARRLKQQQARPEAVDAEANARKLLDLMQQHGEGKVKKEDPDGDEMDVEEYDGPQDGVVCIDSTMEYCRNIGELTSYGITGNRADTDKIDTSKISRDEDRRQVKREEGLDQFESVQKWKRAQAEKERRKREKKEAGKSGSSKKEDRGGWRGADADESRVDSDDEREMMEAAEKMKEEEGSEEEDEDGEYRNVLGDEADLQKGVGAMLKLASQKGYLTDPNAKKTSGQSLEHLKNTRATRMENERFDIEDKYVKKLERMGTTGSGPARSFIEKKDYNPELVIEYVDSKGREMDPKDAFREMSWKFHGKRPGKKQIEKRSNRMEKKELMKKMDSWDTPLGTLNKQLKKQEQMQTPYLVLSNTGKQTELKKD
ncbi:hypothetical protein PMAYCL1PPCAC_29750, partial [Pristionchus mayeri]